MAIKSLWPVPSTCETMEKCVGKGARTPSSCCCSVKDNLVKGLSHQITKLGIYQHQHVAAHSPSFLRARAHRGTEGELAISSSTYMIPCIILKEGPTAFSKAGCLHSSDPIPLAVFLGVPFLWLSKTAQQTGLGTAGNSGRWEMEE